MCLIPNDPEFPVYKLSGSLPRGIAVCIEEKRLLTMAEIAQDILDPEDEMKRGTVPATPRLLRTDSEGSFASAVSSIGTTGSGYIGRKMVNGAALNAPQLAKKKKPSMQSNVTKLEMEFFIKTLNLDIEEDEQPLFHFQLYELGAKMTVKSNRDDWSGSFQIGGCLCQQAKFLMPDGKPVALLSTLSKGERTGEKLLTVEVVRLGEKSPSWRGVHQSVTASLSSVSLCLHQVTLGTLVTLVTLVTLCTLVTLVTLAGNTAVNAPGNTSEH